MNNNMRTRTMRDLKSYRDDSKELIGTLYLAKIKKAVIGGNESALNNAVGNVIDFFASKEFEAQYKDKDLKKANLLKVARETINELYGLPIRRDSKPCKIITHDSMPWTR